MLRFALRRAFATGAKPKVDASAIKAKSGINAAYLNRSVTICRPPKHSMQQGTGQTAFWRLSYDRNLDGQHWENPLMGWTSTSDPKSQTRLQFSTLNEATAYCEEMGLQYVVEKEVSVRSRPKSYSFNFAYEAPPKDEDDLDED